MQITTVLKYNRRLDPSEQIVAEFLRRYGGRYNRAALFGAYSSHNPVLGEDGYPLPQQLLHDAVENLANKGLVEMNTGLELVLNQDEFDIFLELAKNLKQYKELIQAAIDTQGNSHSPYSKFKVGAAILTTEDEIITGTNFENAAYGSTICAERGAIGAAVKDGHLNLEQGKYIKAVAAVLPTNEFGRPCGACRQVIYEFSMPRGETVVVMANPKGEAEVKKIKDILPYAFGPFDLGILTQPDK